MKQKQCKCCRQLEEVGEFDGDSNICGYCVQRIEFDRREFPDN